MSDEIVVRASDGAETSVPVGTTARGALEALECLRGQIVAARVDGDLRDLSAQLHDDAKVEPVRADTADGRHVIRHSTAHVMAQAVTDLFDDAKFAIGPAITDGFYYDFDVDEPFTPEDLERIAERMRDIIREDQAFERRELDRDEALELFSDQPYKRELIEAASSEDPEANAEAGTGQTISVYDNVRPDGSRWPDLCRGPHLPSSRWIPAFQLQRTAGAYWRGDEQREQLQRIYGTAWESRKALKAHLSLVEQARAREHRKLLRELDLASSPDELGTGLYVYHPRGAIVRQTMEDYSRAEHAKRGYQPVYTPHMGRAVLWQTSGHLDYYADGMYPPMRMGDKGHGEAGDYYPKPMNCPFHVLIYRSSQRSYRDLPLRLVELGTVYRYERSGTVQGMLRARGFTQDDAHIFCTPQQVVDEVADAIDFTLSLYRDFGFEGPSRVALSTRPTKAATVGTDEDWAHAEEALSQALERSGLEYVVDAGEGAFYGPKIDFQVTDAIGRAWQLTTIQVDFTLPERFDLTYVDSEGHRPRPFMIHRALFGSLDRFFGVLLEHYAGALPLWLSPVQVVVVPVADRHHDYGTSMAAALVGRGLRAELDASADTMGAKIRRHQLMKVPYQLIVGDDEVEASTVSVRPRTGPQRRGVSIADFAEELMTEVSQRHVSS